MDWDHIFLKVGDGPIHDILREDHEPRRGPFDASRIIADIVDQWEPYTWGRREAVDTTGRDVTDRRRRKELGRGEA